VAERSTRGRPAEGGEVTEERVGRPYHLVRERNIKENRDIRDLA